MLKVVKCHIKRYREIPRRRIDNYKLVSSSVAAGSIYYEIIADLAYLLTYAVCSLKDQTLLF